jgi:serine protease Do
MLLLCLPVLMLLRVVALPLQTAPGVTAPASAASASPDTDRAVYRIPYRLDETQHLAVRARINGKGPFNFIIDTGAPTVYLTAAAAARCEVKPDARGWATFAHMEIEGGATVDQVQARIDEPFQLQGMNALGLATEHLDGIIGYSLLARFRIQIDLTRTKMLWSPSRIEPEIPTEIGRLTTAERAMMKKAASSQKEMEGLAKMATTMFGRQSAPPTIRRGFFGIELADTGAGPRIRAVTPGSPAAQAGLTVGDVVLKLVPAKGDPISTASSAAVLRAAANVAPGDSVIFVLRRGQQRLKLTVHAGADGF